MGLDEEYVERISQAAPLHDIGKVGISDAILLKPGRLNAEESLAVQQHCTLGTAICSDNYPKPNPEFWSDATAGVVIAKPVSSPLLKMAAVIALTHHEKWDGTGYPRGLAGAEIPLEGRIVALADVFDALVSRRPYKPAFSLEKALEIVAQQRGRHFDPAVLDAFMAHVDLVRQVCLQLADTPVPAADEDRALPAGQTAVRQTPA
jgi:putative two-component system response regulator